MDALSGSDDDDNFIKVEIYNLDDKVGVSIEDSGGGVDQEIIDKVFDLYFTTKDASKGTGLGLYMTKTIIENNLNGHIHIKNSDYGLKTIISIPKDGDEIVK